MYHSYDEPRNNKTDSKNKHPFAITCRKCGGNDVKVDAFGLHSLEIKCNSCGFCLDCGSYYTQGVDYSDM